MKVFKCHEPNDNAYFLSKILNSLNVNTSDSKWVISDLELIPVFRGDYSGIGGGEPVSIAYEFSKRVEREKVTIVDINEIHTILEDTQTIRNGIFICLNKQDRIDLYAYRPRVEGNKSEEMYDNRAKCEIRILDGELFFVLEKNIN